MSRPSSPHRRTGFLVFLLAQLVYFTTAGGSLATTDAIAAYEVTEGILTRGTVAIPPEAATLAAHRAPDGSYYSPFGIAQSIYNIPFYLAGAAAQRVTGIRLGKPDTLTRASVALGSTVAAALTVWVTFRFAAALTGSIDGALFAAVTLAFGTSMWPYSKFGFNAPLAALCLIAGSYGLWSALRTGSRRSLWMSGLAFGGALLTRHETGLAFVIAAAVVLFTSGWTRATLVRLAHFALSFAACLAVWLLYNHARFGNPFDAGYLRDPVPGFGSPVAMGLYGLLLSPGASLFVYAPPAVAGILAMRRLWWVDRTAALLLSGQFVAFLAFYAGLANWAAGRSYGPRYLVPLLPHLCVAAAVVWERWRGALIALACVGALVQLPGVLVDFAKVSVAEGRAKGHDRDPRYRWRDAPLLANARAARAAVPQNVRYVFGSAQPPFVRSSATAADRDFSQQFAFSLDFWWLYLFYLRAVSRLGMMLVVAVLAVAIVAAGVMLAASTSPRLAAGPRRPPAA